MVPQNLSDAIIRDTWLIAHPAGILIPLRKVMDFEGKRREEQYYENTTDTSEHSLMHAISRSVIQPEEANPANNVPEFLSAAWRAGVPAMASKYVLTRIYGA
jgi:hypothetical protein